MDKDEVIKRWMSYCSGLYTAHTDLSEMQMLVNELKEISPPSTLSDFDILKETVERAIKRLKNNKS